MKVPDLPATGNGTASLRAFLERVVGGGYCVGCGSCTLGVAGSEIEIAFDEIGRYQARLTGPGDGAPDRVSAVCPFSGSSRNEDEIGAELYGAFGTADSRLGFYLESWAGYVASDDFRTRSSSGGMTSWLLCELLQTGLVDAVVHVKPCADTSGKLFSYQISRSTQEICDGAKSRYYPVEMSGVLREIRERPGRYAFVGLPCFVKAVRLLCSADAVLAGRILFCVSLFCGHLKTAGFASYLAWHCGIAPSAGLRSIDFRKKLPDRDAASYGVEVAGKGPVGDLRAVKPMSEVYGADWGLGFFRYEACDYCDDILGETADVSLGDAWLGDYVNDPMGTNVLVIRHPEIQKLFRQAREGGRLTLTPIGAETVAGSQGGSFRHRRLGLSYRLHLAERAGRWYPPKRVKPDSWKGDARFRRIHRARMALAARSHSAWLEASRADDLKVFEQTMAPLVRRYAIICRHGAPVWRRALSLGKRVLLLPWRKTRNLVAGARRSSRGPGVRG